jgi:hypothetical protein
VTKPFGAPVPVGGVNTSSGEGGAWLSTDQLTIYFARNDADPNLYSATRVQPTEAFSNVAPLTEINTTKHEARPTLTADGLTMFMEVAAIGSPLDIEVSTRASTAASFSAHTPVAVINAANDNNPWISDDGLLMYFSSDRAGLSDIFRTTRASTSSPFNTPMPVGELNTAHREYIPVPSKDGLEIFFGRDGTSTNLDIFHATRSTLNDGFGMPTLISELSNPTSNDYPTWVSPDRCQLMFASNREGGSGDHDIWIATRPQ